MGTSVNQYKRYMMKNKRLEELLEKAPSVELVAHLCGVTTMTVEAWRKKGEVSAYAAIVIADGWGKLPEDLEALCPKQQDWPACIVGGN